jgi:hypothetical protein
MRIANIAAVTDLSDGKKSKEILPYNSLSSIGTKEV